MDYNSIKRNIETVRRNITMAKRTLSKNREEQAAVKASLANTENNYQDRLRASKKEALNSFIIKQTKQYEDEVLTLTEQISEENTSYSIELDRLENANISDFYTDESEISADIKTSVEILQKHIENSLSRRFKNELEKQLDSGSIDMSSENLENLVTYFNRESKYIAKLNKENDIDKVINTVNGLCIDNPLSVSEDKNTASLQIGGTLLIIGIVAICAAKILFPFYIVFLILFASYNVIKSYKIYSALIAQKAVKDNIDKIDEKLRKEAEARLEDRKKQLNEKHLETIADLENRLISAKDKLNTNKIKAESEFVFDDSDTRKTYDTAININNKKIDSLIADEKATNEQLEKYYLELKQLEDELNKVAGSIQASYLDFGKVGTDVIFNPDFIFDIQNGKPIFFKHPQKSCLFLYDDIVDVVELIKLLSVQLRIKLNPFNLNITVVDTQFMGSSFLSMQPVSDKKDDSLKKLFQIVTSNEDVNLYLESCDEELQRKMRSIRFQFDNIANYNKFMLESDSLTEGYEFIFFEDPSQNHLQNETLMKIINNGETLGIFLHLFIQKDEFFGLGENARKITNNVGKIYVLSEGHYHERAKDFVLENMIKNED